MNNIIQGNYYMDINMNLLFELLKNNRSEKVYVSNNDYYHATSDKSYVLNSIYQNGILCKNRINDISILNCDEIIGENNELDKVSLIRNNNCSKFNLPSAYETLILKKPSFLIDSSVNAFIVPYDNDLNKSKDNKIVSHYADEYKVLDKIEPIYINAICLNLLNRLNDNEYIAFATILKAYKIIKWINNNKIDLNFIDLSDNTIVNQEIILNHFHKIKRY